jgi:thymidylate synthase (FAD)
MKVSLLAFTSQPCKVIASQIKNMRGDMVHSLGDVDREEAKAMVLDTGKTKLKGPWEFIDFVWQVDGVTRAFTHQLVRHRVGTSFSQESMRFTNKESFQYYISPSIKTEEQRSKYRVAMEDIQFSYGDLIESGVAIEDARGILPTNILTKIGFKCNFRTLYEIASVRLCLQSQGEWRDFMDKVYYQLRANSLSLFADMLQPACVEHEKCQFKSLFDRKCPIGESKNWHEWRKYSNTQLREE